LVVLDGKLGKIVEMSGCVDSGENDNGPCNDFMETSVSAANREEDIHIFEIRLTLVECNAFICNHHVSWHHRFHRGKSHTKLDDSIQRDSSEQGNEGSTSGYLTVS
jgi:hypothetical protein